MNDASRSYTVSASAGVAGRTSTALTLVLQTRDDVVEVVERLVRDVPLGEVAGEPTGRKDPVRRECRAAVGDAVTDIDDLAFAREAVPLARLAAGRAHGLVAPPHAPALRSRLDVVGDHRDPL